MKFSVGYQLRSQNDYIETLLQYKDRMSDVYVSWNDLSSGRRSAVENCFLPPWESMRRQKEDLSRLSAAGIPLTLLLNANCYGAAALSRTLFTTIGETLYELSSFLNLGTVTTTSPVIARFVRENYPKLDVRASVNMEIGTVEAMTYLAGSFTSFYMKREYNRDMKRIGELRNWCDDHGKGLHVLGNGGCLAHCPARQFHDNLVAHERELAGMDNVMSFSGLCREYLSQEGNHLAYIRDICFIRPEDIALYDPWFDSVKLATRISRNPSLIVTAYMNGHFGGNLLDLLEPDYSSLLYPAILDNRGFPADFGKRVLFCNKDCVHCDYCDGISRTVMRNLEDEIYGCINKPNDQASRI
jgi:hypothetical protein